MQPLALALAIIWAVWVSASLIAPFDGAIPHNVTQQPANPGQKDQPAPPISIIAAIGRFLEDHNGAFTAIATVAIAYFTFTLWRTTSDMQTIAANQHEEMVEATKVARTAALEMVEANRISRESLTASERAWLRPVVTITDARCLPDLEFPLLIGLSIAIENLGKTPAVCVRLRTEDAFLSTMEYIAWDIVRAQTELGAQAKERGDSDLESVIFPAAIDNRFRRLVVGKDRFNEVISGRDAYVTYPVLLGCIDYQIAFSDKCHQTWFAYEITRMEGQPFSGVNIIGGEMDIAGLELHEPSRSRKFAD